MNHDKKLLFVPTAFLKHMPSIYLNLIKDVAKEIEMDAQALACLSKSEQSPSSFLESLISQTEEFCEMIEMKARDLRMKIGSAKELLEELKVVQ